MSEQIGDLNEAWGAWDDDGFHLTLSTDDGEGDLRVTNVQAARTLIAAVKELEPWVADHDYHRADFDAGIVPQGVNVAADNMDASFNDDAYALDDPKHPTYHDRYAAFYDDRDKGVVGP